MLTKISIVPRRLRSHSLWITSTDLFNAVNSGDAQAFHYAEGNPLSSTFDNKVEFVPFASDTATLVPMQVTMTESLIRCMWSTQELWFSQMVTVEPRPQVPAEPASREIRLKGVMVAVGFLGGPLRDRKSLVATCSKPIPGILAGPSPWRKVHPGSFAIEPRRKTSMITCPTLLIFLLSFGLEFSSDDSQRNSKYTNQRNPFFDEDRGCG